MISHLQRYKKKVSQVYDQKILLKINKNLINMPDPNKI